MSRAYVYILLSVLLAIKEKQAAYQIIDRCIKTT